MLAVTAPKNRGTIGLIVGYLGCVGVIFAAHETCQSEALELLLDGQIECADKRRLAAVEAETLRERAEEIRLRHRALIVGAGPIHTPTRLAGKDKLQAIAHSLPAVDYYHSS